MLREVDPTDIESDSSYENLVNNTIDSFKFNIVGGEEQKSMLSTRISNLPSRKGSCFRLKKLLQKVCVVSFITFIFIGAMISFFNYSSYQGLAQENMNLRLESFKTESELGKLQIEINTLKEMIENQPVADLIILESIIPVSSETNSSEGLVVAEDDGAGE